MFQKNARGILRRVSLEIGYRFRMPEFWGVIALGALAFYFGYSTEPEGDMLYLYKLSMSYGIFVIIAPCIAVLPNVRSLCAFKGKMMAYNLPRAGAAKYSFCQCVSAAVIGGLALMLGPALMLAAMACRYPVAGEYYPYIYALDPALNASFSRLLLSKQFLLFFTAKLFLLFLYGMSVNLIAFTVASISSDTFVVAFAPFILLQLTTLWPLAKASPFFRAPTYINGQVNALAFDNTYGFLLFVLAVECGLWIACYVLSRMIMKRRLMHA